MAVAIASSLTVSHQTSARPAQADDIPPFACVLTMAAATAPREIMEFALSVDGLACGRNATSEAVTIVAPLETSSCAGVRSDIPTTARKSISGLEAQRLVQQCSPVMSGTRRGQVVALVKRTTALEFGEIGNELMVYAGWSAVPARYFISGGVGGLSVFCFESDGDTNILAYLEQAGFKDLAQFEILRGAGTCRDVVQAKISLDLPWRDGT